MEEILKEFSRPARQVALSPIFAASVLLETAYLMNILISHSFPLRVLLKVDDGEFHKMNGLREAIYHAFP